MEVNSLTGLPTIRGLVQTDIYKRTEKLEISQLERLKEITSQKSTKEPLNLSLTNHHKRKQTVKLHKRNKQMQ